MAEKEELGKITVVTDDDTGMYRIGEIEGGWNGKIKDHIQDHGVNGLLIHLAYMSTRVIEIHRESNSTNGNSDCSAKPAQNANVELLASIAERLDTREDD